MSLLQDTPSQTATEILWDERLHSDAQWRSWIGHVEAIATKAGIWNYINPSLPEDKVKKEPVDSRDTFPQVSEVLHNATDISALNDAEYTKYSRMVTLFDKERSFNEQIRNKINRIDSLIYQNVAPEHRHILEGKITPYAKLVRLTQQFAPKGDNRRQRVRNAWRDLVKRPLKGQSMDKWLAAWSSLYEEGKALKIPEVVYKDDDGNPEDRDAIRDFLQAVEAIDEVFVHLWRKDLDAKPKEKVPFQDILAAFRNYRGSKQVAKQNVSAVAFAATLNGRNSSSRGNDISSRSKLGCVCGRTGHVSKDCYHINPLIKPSNWTTSEYVKKRIEENLKKLGSEERKEIEKMMKSETEQLTIAKTAQLTITDEGDIPTDTVAFFTATISSHVFKAALTLPLSMCWIVDSGANLHICNRRDVFESFVPDRRVIAMGTGKSVALGHGTAKISVVRPNSGKIEATVRNVWYVPDFQTNIISVSEIKKHGYFFNSEGPYITNSKGVVAHCTEQYGLYLLEDPLAAPVALNTLKKSAKPLMSVASRQLWHRRLGHINMKRLEVLEKMAAGIKIKPESAESPALTPEKCEVCEKSKTQRQVSRRPAGRTHVHGKFGRLHFDLVHIKDGYNQHQWVSHLYCEGIRLHLAQTHEKKNGCIHALIAFIAICRSQFNMDILVLKSDREPTLHSVFHEYCPEAGISVEFSVIGTPEQNGFIERAGGIIVTTARALIQESGLPKKLWPEAITAAVYLLNRVPTKMPTGEYIIPWVEAMKQRDPSIELRPNLANVKLYGCRAYVRIQGIARSDKMAARAETGYLVGFVASNIWKIWLPRLNKVVEVRDVVFDENIRYSDTEAAQLIPQDVLNDAIWDVQYEDSEHERPQYDLDDIALEIPPSVLPSATQNETSVSDQESLVRTIDHSLTKTRHNRINSTPPPMMTPSPTPTPEAPRNEALPGAFPIDRTEAEGVRALDIDANPDQQLLGDLSNTLHQPVTPPPGYRLRGELAPRDIEGSVTTDNIIEGSRTRSKRAHFSVITANEAAEEDPDEFHEGFLMAFNAVFTNKRPHREDLPPAPKNWSEMLRHPHSEGFTYAAAVEVKALDAKGTFKEVDRPSDRGLEVIPLTWVFTYKFDGDGFLVKYKARICVRGDLQKVTNDEKYSATLAVRTARLLFALAAQFNLDSRQYDAVNAFLNALLKEDVYVELPPGMFPKGRRCWKLLRALYGLRRSPRLWQEEATRVLLSLGFKVVQEDLCLFVKGDILLIFYVDDILIFNPPVAKNEADDIGRELGKAWELREMGEAQWFLGIRIIRDRSKGLLWLCQDAYISSMANRYHLAQHRRLEILPQSIMNLKPFNGTASPSHHHEYMSKVGSAQFPTIITRPDAAKATSYLAQFLSNPGPEHLHAIDQVIVYLNSTRNLAICYRKQTIPPSVQFMSDASYGDNHDRKSSAGYICMVFGGPVDWKASKQKTVTTSTTEAELLALSEAAKSLSMWKRLFDTIRFDPGHPVILRCDNQQTISLLTKETPQLRTKLRHVDIHHNWLRQEVQAGRISIEWIKTSDMLADGLTKILPRQKHLEFLRMLGMEDISHLLKGLEDGDQ